MAQEEAGEEAVSGMGVQAWDSLPLQALAVGPLLEMVCTSLAVSALDHKNVPESYLHLVVRRVAVLDCCI